jgi:hypothetical protein
LPFRLGVLCPRVLLFRVNNGEVVGQRAAVAIDADDIGGVVTGTRGVASDIRNH